MTQQVKVKNLNKGDKILARNTTLLEVHEVCPLDLSKAEHWFASLQQHINASREDLYFVKLGDIQFCGILDMEQEVTIQFRTNHLI